MCRHLKPRYSHVILVSGCQLTKTWMCNIRLQAPTPDIRCDILHQMPCGADGQMDVRSSDYQNFSYIYFASRSCVRVRVEHRYHFLSAFPSTYVWIHFCLLRSLVLTATTNQLNISRLLFFLFQS